MKDEIIMKLKKGDRSGKHDKNEQAIETDRELTPSEAETEGRIA